MHCDTCTRPLEVYKYYLFFCTTTVKADAPAAATAALAAACLTAETGTHSQSQQKITLKPQTARYGKMREKKGMGKNLSSSGLTADTANCVFFFLE